MREILFRGKRIDNGEWVHGSLLKVTHNGNTYNLIFADNFLFVFGEATATEHACVHPETVGQFTGLTDKNGKKIFEGDIIRAKLESGNHEGFAWPNMPVDFHQGSFCLNDRKGYVFAALGSFAPSVTFEVIGNIHDNPELLEG